MSYPSDNSAPDHSHCRQSPDQSTHRTDLPIQTELCRSLPLRQERPSAKEFEFYYNECDIASKFPTAPFFIATKLQTKPVKVSENINA